MPVGPSNSWRPSSFPSDANLTLVFGVNVALLILTTSAFIVRFMVRVLHGPGLWWDDWASLIALVINYILDTLRYLDSINADNQLNIAVQPLCQYGSDIESHRRLRK